MELKVIAAEHIIATGNKDGQWTNVYVTPLADAQATVEALQRERDEALHAAQGMSNDLTSIGTERDDLQAALDAEREKVAAHERAYQEGHPSPCTLGSLCPYCEIERRVEQLSQLQALVRTAVERWRAQTNVKEGISFRMAMKALEATLDAATPAKVPWPVQSVDDWTGPEPKGGDGE